MIPRGRKYQIVGVHKEDALYARRDTLKGVLIETIHLSRWRRTQPKNYWHGRIKFLEDDKASFYKAGEEAVFCAVYLRRVKEETK